MWNEVSAHLYKHTKIAVKWPGEAAHIFIYPLMTILSMGILAYFVVSQGAPAEAFTFVFVGVVAWNVYEMAERTMSYGVMVDIFNDCLKHSFVGRSGLRHFIPGNMLYGIIGSVIGLLMAIAAGLFLFGFNLMAGGLFLVANLTFIFIFGTGMGMLLNGIMLSRGARYMALVWSMPGLVMLFSGVFYPPEILPPGIFHISMAMPSTHSITSIRAAIFGMQAGAWGEFLTGALGSVIFFVLGGFIFRLGMKKGKENGTITKY